MKTFTYSVTMTTDTQEHADQVMAERLGCDEDYGFDYSNLNWTSRDTLPDPHPGMAYYLATDEDCPPPKKE